MQNIKDNKAIITLEAALVLPVFILVMMFFYGFIVFFTGQNTVQHALIQTAESLSLDSYAPEKLGDDNLVMDIADFVEDIKEIFGHPDPSDNFSSTEKWYEGDVPSEVEKRFLGFLANGDENAAKKILKYGGVHDIDFSTSSVDSGVLTITVSFKQKFIYDFQGLGVFDRTYTIRQNMWGLE
jgi:hypothetical protein